MAKFKEQLEARKLRKGGKSIKKIAKVLGVSVGSVSLWCRDIQLTKDQRELLRINAVKAGHKGRLMGTLKNKQKRTDAIQHFKKSCKKEIGALSKRDLTILVSALFWAEGAKTGSRFMFVNSDPDMIKCVFSYLVEVEKISIERIFVAIQINRIHEKRIKKVLRFWSSLLGLPTKQFNKPYYINVAPKKIYENHDTYYGIARLGVREGASLQYKFLGYIDALKSDNNILPR